MEKRPEQNHLYNDCLLAPERVQIEVEMIRETVLHLTSICLRPHREKQVPGPHPDEEVEVRIFSKKEGTNKI